LKILKAALIKNSDNPGSFRKAGYLAARGITALRYALSSQDGAEADMASRMAGKPVPPEDSFRHLSFTFSVISLSALVARADGDVTREEYLAFRDAFPLTGGICGKIRQLFLLACQSKTPYSVHVQQIKTLFPGQKELFISLLDRMFRIATADKSLTCEEGRILAKIAKMLDLSPAEYSMLHDRHSRPALAHNVLGVKKRSARRLIKQRYHLLMKRYHPDRFAGHPISPEVESLLKLKSAEITRAYRTLTKKAA
jgi:DnaJ like chaperone protein